MSSSKKYKSKNKKLKKHILIIIALILLIVSGVLYLFLNNNSPVKKDPIVYNYGDIDYEDANELDIELYSNNYLLMRIDDLKVLYCKDNKERFYPASLTKVMTLDVVLNNIKDLNETSSINNEQIQELIKDNASLAYINPNYEYSIEELLYALILPSGADGALAIENYFNDKGLNFINEMNKLKRSLRLKDSNFENSTGMHNDNHYTTIDDLLKIVIKALSYEEGRNILMSKEYTLSDGHTIYSTLDYLNINDVKVLGGKTGFTPDAGMCLILLYEYDNKTYLWISGNAETEEFKEALHFVDAINMINEVHFK